MSSIYSRNFNVRNFIRLINLYLFNKERNVYILKSDIYLLKSDIYLSPSLLYRNNFSKLKIHFLLRF